MGGLGLLFVVMACGNEDRRIEAEAVTTARSFASAYFNYRFNEAFACCAAESRPWLLLKASNLTARDMDVFNAEVHSATVVIDRFSRSCDNDSCATVRCTVGPVLLSDSLERPGRKADRAVYILPLVRRQERWLIKMEGPLRNAE